MKKKMMILILLLASIVLIGYTTLSTAKTTEEVHKEWTVSGLELGDLSLIGAEQDVEVKITRTNTPETLVKLSGKVSPKTKREIEKVKAGEKSLEIILADIDGFSLLPNTEGKDKLKLEVFLGENTDFNQMKIESIFGNIQMTVPEDFQGQYKLEANSGGKVLETPETNETQKSTIVAITMGDIRIIK